MKTILDLTYVEYPSEDGLYGLALGLITLLPIGIFFALAAVFLVNRDLRYAMLVLGLLLSTIGNEGAKKILKEERPAMSHKRGYGMPSDHSQFMAFLFSFFFVHFRANRVLNPQFFIFCLSALAVSSGLVMYSRVYLGVHSVAQVSAGCLIGLGLGAAWARLLGGIQHKWFRQIQLRVDRFWRDNCLIS